MTSSITQMTKLPLQIHRKINIVVGDLRICQTRPMSATLYCIRSLSVLHHKILARAAFFYAFGLVTTTQHGLTLRCTTSSKVHLSVYLPNLVYLNHIMHPPNSAQDTQEFSDCLN